MYCKLLKLTNGENIIVTTDDNCETFKDKEFIDVVDPVEIATLRIPQGQTLVESYIFRPWMRLAASDLMRIPTRNIIVAADLHENARVQYEEYLNTTSEETLDLQQEVQLTEEEQFEDFLDQVLSNEEEDEDGNRSDTRTVH